MNKRLDIIHELAFKKPKLGKTAMVKYLFLLQQAYDVPLSYDFEIYTFGPYSSEVMEDINLAKCQDIVSIDTVSYSNHVGYSITARDYSDKTFSAKYTNEIDELLKLFGDKTVKELELSTTIVYLYRNSKMNKWDCGEDAIAVDVHEIKPHFSIDAIREEYKKLEAAGILAKAA